MSADRGSPAPVTIELRRTVKVVNDQGLHARPCHSIVSAAQDFRSELRIRNGSNQVNGKSIIELMTLEASVGTKLELLARGEDAAELLDSIEALFDAGGQIYEVCRACHQQYMIGARDSESMP